MSPTDLVDLDHHVHLLRTSAEHCRAEASDLRARAEALSWAGVAGAAFREAAEGHVRALRLTAHHLEDAAHLVEQHRLACAVALAVAAEAAAAVEAAASGVARVARALVP